MLKAYDKLSFPGSPEINRKLLESIPLAPIDTELTFYANGITLPSILNNVDEATMDAYKRACSDNGIVPFFPIYMMYDDRRKIFMPYADFPHDYLISPCLENSDIMAAINALSAGGKPSEIKIQAEANDITKEEIFNYLKEFIRDNLFSNGYVLGHGSLTFPYDITQKQYEGRIIIEPTIRLIPDDANATDGNSLREWFLRFKNENIEGQKALDLHRMQNQPEYSGPPAGDPEHEPMD